MIFSNLAGTTSDVFSITKTSARPSGYGENGILLSGNTYDLFWNMSAIIGEKYVNKSVYFIEYNGTTDLNSCVQPGQYMCSWTYFNKLANIPEELKGTTDNFIMIVHPCDYGLYDGRPAAILSNIVQELTTSKGKKYIRYGNGNGSFPQPWQKVSFTSDLHAVATSGDYNTLINKPNVSAGPTVETGTFKLSSNAVDIIQDTSHQYVKYGNLCFVNLDFSFIAKSPRKMIGIGGLPFKARGLYKGQPMQMIADLISDTGAIYVVPRFYFDNAFTLLAVSYHQITGFIVWNEMYSDDLVANTTCYVRGSFIYPCE